MSSQTYCVDTVYPLPRNASTTVCRTIFSIQEDSIAEMPADWTEYCGGLVAKPSGQVGSPGRGGYNLQTVLAWDPATYRTVQKFLQSRIRYYIEQRSLFGGLTITKQPPNVITTIQDEAKHKFEILSRYDQNWPSRDIITTFLANASVGKRK